MTTGPKKKENNNNNYQVKKAKKKSPSSSSFMLELFVGWQITTFDSNEKVSHLKLILFVLQTLCWKIIEDKVKKKVQKKMGVEYKKKYKKGYKLRGLKHLR